MTTQNQLPGDLFRLGRLVVAMKPEIISLLADVAVEFIDDNFDKEGFQGDTFKKWPKRKKDPKGPIRKILVGKASGTLRRSPKKILNSNNATIAFDLPYTQIHNEGGVITHKQREVILNFAKKKLIDYEVHGKSVWRFEKVKKATLSRKATIYAHSYKMPQRQFIGQSPVLDKMCEEAVLKFVTKRLKENGF